jgi:hypothetical protein
VQHLVYGWNESTQLIDATQLTGRGREPGDYARSGIFFFHYIARTSRRPNAIGNLKCGYLRIAHRNKIEDRFRA